MKLDKRIIAGKRPLTYFEAEQGDEFIGKECYFSDYACKYEDLDTIENTDDRTLYIKDFLKLVDTDCQDRLFKSRELGVNYRYCLPCEWVKESEKKWRPYTGIEFAEKFGIWVGYVIRIRDRPENAGQEYEYKIMFVGYRWYKGMFEVFINGCWIDLLTLFELYEYMEDGEWHKFGVEE